MKRFFARLHSRVSQAYNTFFPATLKKRTWWPVFLVGVILIAIVAVVPVHAGGIAEDVINFAARTLASLLIELAKLCIFLTIFFLRAFITFASYNNFIDVSVVKLGWVMVRDVANMFFIVGLLVIAFATILGFESYEWKHGLVHIVLMAILINFSNLIAQLIIDVAHIFTITFLNAVSATAGGNLITLFQMDKVLALASGSSDALGQTKNVADLTLFAGAVLAFIFALLAALSIGAYLVVMIFRIVYLWALIVLSPLAFMLHAIPKGEDYSHEWWHEFNKQVIVAPIMVFFLWLAFATLGTGQIITEIQGSPNVIQLNASGEADAASQQSVSILEISTWENFASFLLGIGFLWVGIKKTEETGAAGSHLVGGAIDWTKNVATIATGYAAGRWLVGKTAEHGSGLMHATGEYLSLGGSKVLDKTGIVGKAIRAPGRYLRDSAARRHEALHHRDKREELRQQEVIAKFNEHPTGLSGLVAPSHESLAEQEARTKFAERAEHAVYAKYLSAAQQDFLRNNKDKVKNTIDTETVAHGVEHAVHGVEADLTATIKLAHAEHEKGDFDKNLRIGIGKGQGWTENNVEEFLKIQHEEDDEKRAEMEEKFDAQMEKEGKKKRPPVQKLREYQLQAAENLPHIYAALLDNQAKDKEKAAKGIQDEAVGRANLDLVQGERDTLATAIKNAMATEIRDRAIEIAAIKSVEQAISEGKIGVDEREKSIQEKKELYAKYNDDKFKKEILEHYRDEALSTISDQQKAQIAQKVILDNSYKTSHGHRVVDPQWIKVFAEYSTRAAEQKIKKAQVETEGISLKTSDILRGSEGKLMDQVRNAQRAKISSELKEFGEWTQEEIFNQIIQLRNTLTALNKKSDALGGDKNLNFNDSQLLKNTNQALSQLVATAESKGWHGGLISTLRGTDSSYAGLEDTSENAGKLLLGLLSGRQLTEIDDENKEEAMKKFVEVEDKWRMRNKEKADVLARTVQKGIQDSAEKYGNIHLYSQFREGMDEVGEKKVGFAYSQKVGAGSGKRLGSGRSKGLGGQDIDGLGIAYQDMTEYVKPTHKVAGIGDFRAFSLTSKKDGKRKTRLRPDAQKGLIAAAYTTMNPDDFISKEGKAKMKGMIGGFSYGGQFEEDGVYYSEIYDGEKIATYSHTVEEDVGGKKVKKHIYTDVDDTFKEEWKPVFAEWSRILNESKSNPTSPDRLRTIARWKRLYQSWDIPNVDKMDVKELEDLARNSGLIS